MRRRSCSAETSTGTTAVRAARYERITDQLQKLIEGRSPNLTAAMATICALLHAKMTHHLWTGFYLAAGHEELHVGPYQGPVACQVLRERGICVHAVRTKSTLVVPDVAAFPGHVACDPRSRSEIAVPLIKDDRAVAVLDIDSERLSQFGVSDVVPLERIVSLLLPFA